MRLIFSLILLMAAGTAAAQSVDPRVAALLKASQLVMSGDLPKAEAAYGQVIAADPSYTEAYLQRAVVRRELNQIAGVQADAQTAVRLADIRITAAPNDSTAYHQRGMGHRLLGQFAQARQDAQAAIRLGGNWSNDLQAIALEEKMAAQ